MSVIWSPFSSQEMPYTVSSLLSRRYDATRTQDGMDVYVQVKVSVLGYAGGRMQSSTVADRGRATGGSLDVGIGSGYCVADTTIPFHGDYVIQNRVGIKKHMADIQNKLSVNLTCIQGEMSSEAEGIMRETAMRSEAIRMAKNILQESEASVDQDTLQKIVLRHKGKAVYTMSLTGGIRTSWSCRASGAKAEWARSKGYRELSGKDILAISAQEKGLKKVYLPDEARIQKAQEFVYQIGSTLQGYVDTLPTGDWKDDYSIQVLAKMAEIIPGNPNGEIKQVEEFSIQEQDAIQKECDAIVAEYREQSDF